MKEDSIEEDIKNAENFIKSIKTDKEYKEENGWHGYYNKEIVELARMLEHILSDYKRVLKENEEWDRKFCNLQNLYFKLQDESESKRKEWQEAYKSEKKMKNEYIKLYQDLLLKENVIPIQKIKDNIKELDNVSYAEELEDIMNRKNYTITELVQYVLKQLLDGNDTNVGSI